MNTTKLFNHLRQAPSRAANLQTDELEAAIRKMWAYNPTELNHPRIAEGLEIKAEVLHNLNKLLMHRKRPDKVNEARDKARKALATLMYTKGEHLHMVMDDVVDGKVPCIEFNPMGAE